MSSGNAPYPKATRLLTPRVQRRSEEHTSELQSQSNLVCRLLLEKKKKEKNRCQIAGVAKEGKSWARGEQPHEFTWSGVRHRLPFNNHEGRAPPQPEL